MNDIIYIAIISLITGTMLGIIIMLYIDALEEKENEKRT